MKTSAALTVEGNINLENLSNAIEKDQKTTKTGRIDNGISRFKTSI